MIDSITNLRKITVYDKDSVTHTDTHNITCYKDTELMSFYVLDTTDYSSLLPKDTVAISTTITSIPNTFIVYTQQYTTHTAIEDYTYRVVEPVATIAYGLDGYHYILAEDNLPLIELLKREISNTIHTTTDTCALRDLALRLPTLLAHRPNPASYSIQHSVLADKEVHYTVTHTHNNVYTVEEIDSEGYTV